MIRGPLAEQDYRPQFSGHETFPLRYGWLKKVFDQVSSTEADPNNKAVFLAEDSIARFGVGKNMVASMRHWASVSRIILDSPSSNSIKVSELGRMLFDKKGLDPYMEHPATVWLIHWQLAAHPEKTTWFWAFNHYPALTFEREALVKALERLANETGWSRVAPSTIKNDVACFVRTYVGQEATGVSGNDDALESPLTELGLLKATGKRDGFRFVRGPKTSLGPGVFMYALVDFWDRFSSSATLSFEAIAHAPGSPGRVFLLDENDLVDRLALLDEQSKGRLRWSETAGLKQVVRDVEISASLAMDFMRLDYSSNSVRGSL